MLAFYVITKSCNRQSFQAIISSNHFKQSFQAIITCMQGCHQIVDIREFCIQSGKIMGKERCFKIGKNHGSFQSRLVLLQGIEFFHTQSHIQLSVAIAKFHPFEYYSVFMQSL